MSRWAGHGAGRGREWGGAADLRKPARSGKGGRGGGWAVRVRARARACPPRPLRAPEASWSWVRVVPRKGARASEVAHLGGPCAWRGWGGAEQGARLGTPLRPVWGRSGAGRTGRGSRPDSPILKLPEAQATGSTLHGGHRRGGSLVATLAEGCGREGSGREETRGGRNAGGAPTSLGEGLASLSSEDVGPPLPKEPFSALK